MELSSPSPDRPVLEVELSTIVPQASKEEVELSTIDSQTSEEEVELSTIVSQTSEEEVKLSTIVSQASEEEVELSTIYSQTSEEEVEYRTIVSKTPVPTAGRMYISFTLESFFSFGLGISYVVSDTLFIVLMTWLTNVWQLKLIQAVIITNVQEGAKSIIVIIIASLDDVYLGSSLTYLVSSILYCGGLVMLYVALPSVTDEDIEACQKGNICKEQQLGILFFLALFLVTIGQCGSVTQRKSFDWMNNLEKLKKNPQRKMKRLHGRSIRGIHLRNMIRKYLLPFIVRRKFELIGFCIAIFYFPPLFTIQYQLLICAWMFGVGSCLFIAGRWLLLYPFEGPRGSPILQILHVILVASKKWQYDITLSVQYFGREIDGSDIEHANQMNSETTNGLTDSLGFLNRAALYNRSPENPQAELADGRLCKVKEVEDAKCFLRAAFLSLTFLMYGLVKSVSSTFFVEQADNMELFGIPVLLLIYSSYFTEYLVTKCIGHKRIEKPVRFHGALRIALGLFISVVCFIVASFVENKRLKLLQNHKKKLPAFWLLPQMVLMGAMNGLANNGIENFYSHEMPDAVSISYGTVLAEGITGVGILLSTALITLVDKATKIHGHPGWFQHGLDDSRIDKFYLVMIGFGFLFWLFNSALVVFLVRFDRSSHLLHPKSK